MSDKSSLLASIASDWWWEMDSDLRFIFISERFTEIFGLPVFEFLGKRRTDLPHRDYDSPAWRVHLDDIAHRRSFRDFETSIVDASGETRPVKISGAPIYASNGEFQGYIGVGHDLTELRRNEQAVEREARNLASILQNVDQGVILIDPDLRVATFNRCVVDWLDLTSDIVQPGDLYEDVVRRLASRGEYDPEPREQAIARRLENVRAGRRVEGERERPDGRILSVVFTPMAGGGGVMTYTDVTVARRREMRLARSEDSFRARFRNLPLPQWVYSTRTLKFLEVNDAAIAKYGYSREEFLAMSVEDLHPLESRRELREWLAPERVARFHTVEWRHRAKDRTLEVDEYVRDIDFEGEPARLSLLIDNTARRQAERLTQRLFETSQDIIFVVDAGGSLRQVTPSVSRVLGWMPDEMVGRGADEFILPADLEGARTQLRAARMGRQVRDYRCRYRHKEGRIVSLAWTGVWSQQERRFYFIGRDMTEFDRTEAQLRQSQKMEAVGQLTGGVAHDFNNILMVIMANVEALDEDRRIPADLHQQIEGIDKATQRAADLTRQLLAFSRRQALQPERTDIDELVAATTQLMRRALGESIEIETLLARDLWTVEVDRSQLQSALVNICINARDAMPEGGRILIETRNVTLDADYAAHNVEVVPGDYVMIAITDNGMGIEPENIDKVFEPFFTTKQTGQGTGLGLSMVYGFVRQSNGHVSIYSEPGCGTTIRLHLPRDLASGASVANLDRPVSQRGSERILLVEDDPLVRASVKGQLVSLGYEVVEAGDGEAALAVLASADPPFDLMLTDIVMPGSYNGRALADEAARRWPRLRCVFMSGYTESAVVHHGRLDPDVLLLAKPFRRHELAQILRQALDVSSPR